MHRTMYEARAALLPALLALPFAACAHVARTADAQQQLPLKLAPRPTSSAINEADLMTRLYIFADDSMMGRQFGREGNMKGTNYIARELQRLGIEPAGENGTYFQSMPLTLRRYTNRSTLSVDGRALRWIDDFIAVPGQTAPLPFTSAQVVYGGVMGDSMNQIAPAAAAGKVVVLTPNPQGPTGGIQTGPRGVGGGVAARFPNAAAIVTVDLQTIGRSAREFINNPVAQRDNPSAPTPQALPATLRVTREAAAQLFARSIDGLAVGTTGGTVTARLDFVQQPVPEYGRNVIGLIRGSDPALRGQYVVISAHNDHTGFSASPVDHDSLYAFNHARLVKSFVGTESIRELTAEERADIRVNVDSLRRIRPMRLDSIRNGADDDGSGSMAVLEIAEAVAALRVKPKRSIIFMWHTGEESGLLGAQYFINNPTVPRDSIVANINLDMVGRGRADDLPGGGPNYVAPIGSDRLSSDIRRAVEAVNQRQPKPLRLDYRFDEDVRATLGSSYNNIYGRSDHARYAAVGIPIVFFFTGLHADYHQVTDEPQYIDYANYTAITRYVNDLLLEIANAAKRPALDRPRT